MTDIVTIGGADLVPHGADRPPANGAGGPSPGSSSAAAPAPTLLPIPRRLAWVPGDDDDLPEVKGFADAYPGFRFQLWLNYPKALQADLTPPKEVAPEDRERRTREALKKIVLAHNGWAMPDDAGAPVALPAPTTDAFWEAVPDELAAAMVLIVLRAPSRLPNSMLATLVASRPG